MIDPLYGGHSAHEIFQALLDNPDVSAYEAVRDTWKPQLSAKGDFEFNWRKVLHDGFIADTAFQPRSVSGKASFAHRVWLRRAMCLKSSSGLTPMCMTGAMPTWDGYRRFPAR